MKLHTLRVTALLPFVAIVLAAGIFIADTITNLELALPALYTAIVLIAARFCKKRGVLLVGAGCIVLTLLSDLFTVDAVVTKAGIINTAISLLAIAATTYLVLKIESEKDAALQLRSQLAHITRVTALGEMTASIAHEVNQPLAAAVINGNACLRWLDADPPNLAEAKQAADRVVRDANRASEVIVQVRNLTKNAPTEKAWVAINEIISATVAIIDREVHQHQVSLQTELAPDLPPVQGDRVQVQQVILNLVLNAIEAMSLVPAGPRNLVISSVKEGSDGVRVSVRDTGAGFAPENLDRLFNAFYTTKRGGMGMGLAISRSIVEAHGGRIWAVPNSERGAVFHFILPVGDEADA